MIRRQVIIHTRQVLLDLNPIVLDPGTGSNEKRERLDILFDGKRFWALEKAPPPMEILSEVQGMRETVTSSETQSGEYKRNRGPSLTTKRPKPTTKIAQDEKRRQDEKSNSEIEIKMEAMAKLNDSLKA